MKIGIDISQLAFKNTGVANYLSKLIESLIENDKENEYIFFFSSFRQNLPAHILKHQSNPKVTIKCFKFPPSFLDLIWNNLHILPIDWLMGKVDLLITSDWVEPPSKSKKATIIYDLIVYKFPKETAQKIIDVQKRKLKWVKKESDLIFTISESSKKDIEELLGIDKSKIKVIIPGL